MRCKHMVHLFVDAPELHGGVLGMEGVAFVVHVKEPADKQEVAGEHDDGHAISLFHVGDQTERLGFHDV